MNKEGLIYSPFSCKERGGRGLFFSGMGRRDLRGRGKKKVDEAVVYHIFPKRKKSIVGRKKEFEGNHRAVTLKERGRRKNFILQS